MKRTRFLSLILAFCMMLSVMPSTSAFAAEPESVMETYPDNTSVASIMTTSFGPGDWYWGGVTFTGSNGGAYKTINGDRVKIKVAFKAVDGDPTSYHLYLSFVQYGGAIFYYRDYDSWSVNPDGDGYLYYESGWINVNYGVDYRFLYDTNSECLCDDDRRLNVHIWIEVE